MKSFLGFLGFPILGFLSFYPTWTGIFNLLMFIPILYLLNSYDNKRSLFFVLSFTFFIPTLATIWPMTSYSLIGVVVYSYLHWIPFVVLLLFYSKVKNRFGSTYGYLYFISAYIFQEFCLFEIEILMPISLLKSASAYYASYLIWIKYLSYNFLSIAILTVNILLFHFFFIQKSYKVGLSIVASFGILFLGGLVETEKFDKTKEINVALINPNESYYGNEYITNPFLSSEKLMDLTDSLIGDSSKIDLIIWPETSAIIGPYVDQIESFPVSKKIMEWCKNHQSELIYGSIGFSNTSANDNSIFINKHSDYNEYYKTHNIGIAISPFRNADFVSKSFFMPFSETIPYANTLGFLQRKFNIIKDFPVLSEYEKEKVVSLKTSNYGLMLCYDALYPSVYYRANKSKALVSITNEIWQNSKTFAQRIANISVINAVEYNKPILRCSNGGFNGICSPDGNNNLENKSVVNSVKISVFLPIYNTLHDMVENLILLSSIVLILVSVILMIIKV